MKKYDITALGEILIDFVPNGTDADVLFKGENLHIPSVAAKTVDTTGAGDIFFGTFVSEFVKSGKRLDELTFENAVDFTKKAVLISGKSTEKHGAIASIPDMI